MQSSQPHKDLNSDEKLYVQSDFLNLTHAVTEYDLLAARLENFILKTKGDLVLKLADFGLAKLMEEPKEPTSKLDLTPS